MKRLLKVIRSYFSSPLPMGRAEWNAWTQEIIDLSGMPDNDSSRFALSAMIMHLGPKNGMPQDKMPKRYFVKNLRKAAANEVAHAMLSELKDKAQSGIKAPGDIINVKAGSTSN